MSKLSDVPFPSVLQNSNPAGGILSNPNATVEARELYQYLCRIQGKQILSGQQESTWVNGTEDEMEYILRSTGKLPALRGLDFIDNDFEGVVQRSIDWWNRGGIVSICWHWGAPPDGIGYLSSKGRINLSEALTPGTPLYENMLAQMDTAAAHLKQLQDAGVPVLWRPLHEFDGGWFWWGKNGASEFIQLWRLMYDRFTAHHRLNNLIWVLGYSHKVRRGWYPGDGFVDVAGSDYYGNSIRLGRFRRLVRITCGRKPLAYHECGRIPDPDKLQAARAEWIWFLTWHTKHIRTENTLASLKRIYNHPYVVTLEDLPCFHSPEKPSET